MTKILVFVLLTFGLNVWLDSLRAAIFVALKLLIVCWATLAYTQTLSVLDFARRSENLLLPLRKLGLDVDSVVLVICLSLSMVPILRREVVEMQYAIRAKGMNMNMRNAYYVMSCLLTKSIRRVNELDMALRAKGIV